jgi:hypothetical protein
MKKLIAILVVFAIMVPALFAQDAGQWSVGSKGQIGTRVDLTPWELRNEENENSDQMVPLVGMASYQGYHNVEGQFDLNYRKDGIYTGLRFRNTSNISGFVEFNNGTTMFRASANMIELLGGFSGVGMFGSGGLKDNGQPANLGSGETFAAWEGGGYYSYTDKDGKTGYRNVDSVGIWSSTFGRAFSDLWGEFKLLDGIINLRVAARSGGSYPGLYWTSENVIGPDMYTQMDGSNYLGVNIVPIQGFEVGLILPGIFDIGWTGGGSRGWGQQDADTTMADVNNISTADDRLRGGAYRRLVQDSIERMTFGLKYAAGPFVAAVQYGLRGRPMFYDEGTKNIRDTTFLNSVVYLGGKFSINSNMSAALDIRGEFFKSFTVDRDNIDQAQEDVTRTALAIGGKFNYNDGPMGASLGLVFFNDIWTAGWTGGDSSVLYGGQSLSGAPSADLSVEGGVFRLSPTFTYDVVPTHLRFSLKSDLDLPLSEWTLNRYDPWDKTEVKDPRTSGDVDDWRGYGNGVRAFNLGYNLTPEIFFNVMGTGATGSAPPDSGFNGISARYRLSGLLYTGDLLNKRASHPSRHDFDIIFRWSF